MSYIAPEYEKRVFTCIHCNSNTQQNWDETYFNSGTHKKFRTVWGDPVGKMTISTCHICEGYILWLDENIIYPLASNIPLPNGDMPKEIADLYLEARAVFPISKKACAALLRLSLQKLCIELGEAGKNINDDIAKLVEKGLSPEIQMALDIIRITGNQAVHPGELDLEDNVEQTSFLFILLNIIVYEKYTRIRKIKEMYSQLPTNALEAVGKRDKK